MCVLTSELPKILERLVCPSARQNHPSSCHMHLSCQKFILARSGQKHGCLFGVVLYYLCAISDILLKRE